MKQERMEILEMMKDGKISTEEAERLLAALDQPERKSREDHDGDDDFGFFPRFEIPMGRFRDFGKMFGGYGRMFGNTMKSAFHGMGWEEDDDEESYEEAGSEGLPVSPGTKLTIRQSRNRKGVRGNIMLAEAEGEVLRIEGTHKIRRRQDSLIVICSGDCTVYVPGTCTSVKVAVFSGDIHANGLNVPVTLNTMDGNLRLKDSPVDSSCTTMSGDVFLERPDITKGETQVSSMSGNITVLFSSDWDGTVEAGTMSGNIEADIPGAVMDDPHSFGQKKVRISMPEGNSGKSVSCMTMSGNIEISMEQE